MASTCFPESLRTLVNEVSELASVLWQKGWVERNAGNFSVDVTGLSGELGIESDAPVSPGSRDFLVKATGARFRDIARKPGSGMLLLRVPPSSGAPSVIWSGAGHAACPTSEMPSHIRIHELLRRLHRPEKAALHAHPPALVAMTHLPRFLKADALNRTLWGMHPEVKAFVPHGAALAPYRLPGSDALAEATAAGFESHSAVLWEKHGGVAVGRDLWEAFDILDILNKAAEIWFTCRRATGRADPPGLSESQIGEIGRAFGRGQA